MTDTLIIVTDLRELDGMIRDYDGADVIVQDELLRVAGWTAAALEALAKQLLEEQEAVDTGNLINSIAGEVEPIAGGVEAIAGTNVSYAEAVERGRAAGEPMPPPDVLLEWMRRHGIPETAEFVIRRAIAERGIEPRPYLEPAMEQLRPQINRELAQVPDRVFRRLRSAV